MQIFENTNGITVRELKQLLEKWPETDEYGNPMEVWLETHPNHTNPLRSVVPLNRRCDEDTGVEYADIMLSPATS